MPLHWWRPGVRFVPYNGKIADITHADTNKHTLDLATALVETRKIIAIIVLCVRITGTDNIIVYPNEGVLSVYIRTSTGNTNELSFIFLANGSNRLQYSLTTSGDDFDLNCFGYVVEA